MQGVSNRKLPVVAGAVGWVHEVPQYGLPEGMLDRQAVTVLRMERRTAWVRTGDGREWQVYPSTQIDCGELYDLGDGQWRPESDPAVREHLARELARYEVERWQEPVDDIRRGRVTVLAWVLERGAPLSSEGGAKNCANL